MSTLLRVLIFLQLTLGLSYAKTFTLDLKPPKSSGHFFVLHRFNDSKHASTSISNHDLEKHFDYLKKHNYYTATLDEIIAKLKKNEPIPSNWVHFCIDDSYKSFYANGLPLFKKHKIPFTLYVYVEATERHYKDFMSWEQIKETMKYGTIGLHSFGHKHMTHMTPEEMRIDTEKSLALIKKRLGIKPTSYAYPYGEYDATLQKVIKSFNFDLIMNQNQGGFSHKSPLDDLDRIALTGKVSIKTKLRIKYLPANWLKVDVDRKNRVLRSISLEIDPKFKSVECYISGDTWHRLKPKKGKITKIFNKKLKFNRSRVIIKTPDNAWTSQIIVF
jgi:peptidoglycan/xylan/chitin deacetylase (PgdA/CDA1 family)